LSEEQAPDVAGRSELATQLDEEALARAMQHRLLAATAWIETCPLPIDKTAWSDYRQRLTSVSSQPGWPHDIIWPEPPRR